MSAERREQYAAALSKLDGWRAEHIRDHGQRPEYLAAADAVMAVADAENARLRAELGRVRDLHTEVPGSTASSGGVCWYCFESWPCATIDEGQTND